MQQHLLRRPRCQLVVASAEKPHQPGITQDLQLLANLLWDVMVVWKHLLQFRDEAEQRTTVWQ
jgi:hypothetical protein